MLRVRPIGAPESAEQTANCKYPVIKRYYAKDRSVSHDCRTGWAAHVIAEIKSGGKIITRPAARDGRPLEEVEGPTRRGYPDRCTGATERVERRESEAREREKAALGRARALADPERAKRSSLTRSDCGGPPLHSCAFTRAPRERLASQTINIDPGNSTRGPRIYI